MLRKAISLALAVALLQGSIAAQDQLQSPTQSVAKMQKVLRKAQEKNKAATVVLMKKIDSRKTLSGNVSDISDTGFVVTDQKTGATSQLLYADVREVHQKGMKKGEIIAIGVVTFVVFIVIYLSATGQWVRD